MRKILLLSVSILCFSRVVSAESLKNELFGYSNQSETTVIEKVFSADIVQLENKKVIRLIGLKAPKAPRAVQTTKKEFIFRDDFGTDVAQPESPITSVEENAFNYAKSLLEGKTVRLEYDVENRDRSSRLQAYVFLKDGTFANAEILRRGFAYLNIVPPNTKYADKLRKAYQEARKELRGLQGE